MINSYDEIKNLLKKSRERKTGLLKEEEGRELTPPRTKKKRKRILEEPSLIE